MFAKSSCLIAQLVRLKQCIEESASYKLDQGLHLTFKAAGSVHDNECLAIWNLRRSPYRPILWRTRDAIARVDAQGDGRTLSQCCVVSEALAPAGGIDRGL